MTDHLMMVRGTYSWASESAVDSVLKHHDFCFLNENVEVRVKIKSYEAVNHKLHSSGSS